LNGDEDYKEKAVVAKSYQNWKTKVLERYFLVVQELNTVNLNCGK
jgi:hypothetical protein